MKVLGESLGFTRSHQLAVDVRMFGGGKKIAEELGKDLKDFRLINNIPIIVEIPDKKGRKKEHVDFVSHLIKKAVGIEVSKK